MTYEAIKTNAGPNPTTGTELVAAWEANFSQLLGKALAEPHDYVFNGSDMSLLIPSYRTLGDPAIYRRVTFEPDSADYVVPSVEPITELCRIGANYLDGVARNISILDSSPLHNVWAVYGDGHRFVELDNEKVLDADFTIALSWIRANKVDPAGTGAHTLLASNAETIDTLTINDTANASASSITLTGLTASVTWAGALSGIAVGQHVEVRILRVAGVLELFVDGVSAGTDATVIGNVSVDTFLTDNARSEASALRAGAMGKVILQGANIFTADLYGLNEGTGDTVTSVGLSGKTRAGKWTNAAWDWVPNNSRFYAVDDAKGSTVKDTVGGQDGNIANFDPAAWVARTRNALIWDKPPGEPVVLVLAGQSNGGAPNIAANPRPINPRVFDFATQEDSAPQSGSPSWLVPQTTNRGAKNDWVQTSYYTGHRQGGRGDTAVACADSIQRLTGRDVYIIQVWRYARPIADWLGSAGVLLDSRVAAAFATPELSGITRPDAVLWMQGESNGETASATYAADWQTWRAATEGVWTTEGVTPFYVFDFTQEYNWVGSSTQLNAAKCLNMPYVAANNPSPITYVNSTGIPSEPGEEIHFSGDGSNLYGDRFANAILYQQ